MSNKVGRHPRNERDEPSVLRGRAIHSTCVTKVKARNLRPTRNNLSMANCFSSFVYAGKGTTQTLRIEVVQTSAHLDFP